MVLQAIENQHLCTSMTVTHSNAVFKNRSWSFVLAFSLQFQDLVQHLFKFNPCFITCSFLGLRFYLNLVLCMCGTINVHMYSGCAVSLGCGCCNRNLSVAIPCSLAPVPLISEIICQLAQLLVDAGPEFTVCPKKHVGFRQLIKSMWMHNPFCLPQTRRRGCTTLTEEKSCTFLHSSK